MAITFVDSQVVAQKSSSEIAGLTPPTHFTVQQGDVIVALFVFDNLTETTPTIDNIGWVSSSPGTNLPNQTWTRLGQVDSPQAAAAGGVRTELWWATMSADGIHHPYPSLSAAVTAKAATYMQFRGIDPTITPVVTSGFGTTSTTSPAAPAYGLIVGGSGHEGNSQPDKLGGLSLPNMVSLGTKGASAVTNAWATLGYVIQGPIGQGSTNNTWSTTDGGQIYAKFEQYVAPVGSDVQKIAIGSALVGINNIYIGSTKVNRIYVGSTMVYDDV